MPEVHLTGGPGPDCLRCGKALVEDDQVTYNADAATCREATSTIPSAQKVLLDFATTLGEALEALKDGAQEVAHIYEGADPVDKDPSTVPTPGQLWHQLLTLPWESREQLLQTYIDHTQRGVDCLTVDHRARIAELETRVRTLLEINERQAETLRQYPPGGDR